MEKKTKILLGIVVVIIVIGAAIFIVLNDPLSDLEYVNREFGFGLNPPENWDIVLEYIGRVTFAAPSDEVYLAIQPFESSTIEPMNLSTMIEETLETYESLYNNTDENITQLPYGNFSLISENERMVNGRNAYEFVCAYDDIFGYYNASKIKEKVVIIVTNGKGFSIKYIGSQTSYDKYESIVEQSINTLVII